MNSLHARPTLPLPEPLSADVLQVARAQFNQLMNSRSGRPLWNCAFSHPGMGPHLFIELRPNLVLMVRNRLSGRVLTQSQPVEIGPHDPANVSIDDRPIAWRSTSFGNNTDTKHPPGGDQP